MTQLQSIGILIGAVGGVIGAIGGILTTYRFFQDQGDRRRKKAKEEEDAAFDEWATAYEMHLGDGDGRRVLEVPDQHLGYATRAVREGRLAWTGFPRMIALPRHSTDR